MAEGVKQSLLKMIRIKFSLKQADAEKKLEELELQGRYIEEIFGTGN